MLGYLGQKTIPETFLGDENRDKESLATRIVKIASSEVDEFFHDQYGEPWARFAMGDHFEHYPLEGRPVRDLIAKMVWEREGTAIYREALKAAMAVLSAKARFEGERHTLHTRCAWHKGEILIDLSNDKWQAVRITPEGWEIVDNPPIFFRRYPHQKPMEVGEAKAKLDLSTWLNMKDGEDNMLFHIWLAVNLIPDIPHPVIVFYGPQGSAKTTHSKMAKTIIDPSDAEILSIPRDIAELAQILDHHHLCAFDNLTSLPGWVSDALSRAVSGDGFSKRKLFTDADDIVFRYQRCLIINGINIAATRPDLLDRSIILELDRLKTMKTEEEVWGGFREALADTRATVFSLVSRAMKLRASVPKLTLPRMADFTRWGYAMAEAMGVGGGSFARMYYTNIGRQSSLVIEDSPVGSALVGFMENRETWKGQPGELLQRLGETADILGINTKKRGWPGQPNTLTRQLRRLKINLESTGLGMEEWHSGQRYLRFFKNNEINRPNRPSGLDFNGLSVDGNAQD